MKRFAFVGWTGSTGPAVPAGGRARHLDNLAAAGGEKSKIPDTPTVEAIGPEDFPIDALFFRSSAFSDPQDDEFGAMKWRIGEITPPGTPFDPHVPRVYEWPAVWEKEFSEFTPEIQIPLTAVRPGAMYRVRVRMKDATGRWSHWSDPVEFTTTEPLSPIPQLTSLRITEIMYDPVGDPDFEFIEITNVGSAAVDVTDVSLRSGIEFSFAQSAVEFIEPGEHVVVVQDVMVFPLRYSGKKIRVAGEYRGTLDNEGERIELVYGRDLVIHDFAYKGDWYESTAGGGRSLVIRNPEGALFRWSVRGGWKPSEASGGSPGEAEKVDPRGLQRPGDLNRDGRLTVSDAVVLLRLLFSPDGIELPCGDGTLDYPSNLALVDMDGDGKFSVADPIHFLSFVFRNGPPPALGTECVPLEGCPDACGF